MEKPMTNYTMSFNEEEIQVLAGLLDIALKAAGVQALKPVHHFITKLEAAEPDTHSESESVETDDLIIEAETANPTRSK